MRKNIFGVGIAALIFFVLAGCSQIIQKQKETGIGTEAARNKIEKLISDSGGSATVKDVVEDGDLYKIIVEANGQEQPVYVTKDGTKFIESVITFEEIEKQRAEAKKSQEEAAKPVEKSERPKVDLYLMSFCPFGNKAEDTMESVYELLKDKADFNFHYIVTVNKDKIQSLQGEIEVEQNKREACVLKNYGKSKWFDFITYVNKNCGSDGSCWETAARNSGLDVGKIKNCVSSQGFELMKSDANTSSAAGATGSPTLFINGSQRQVVYQYGNSEAYKKEICSAFKVEPKECSQKLISSETQTTQGGSCGN